MSGVLVIDGMHADYAGGQPNAPEPELNADNVDIWEQLGRDAKAGRKRFLVTHSEIFPGTYASTTETADYLLARLKVKCKAVLKWGPVGMQQLSEASAGKFLLLGFAATRRPTIWTSCTRSRPS